MDWIFGGVEKTWAMKREMSESPEFWRVRHTELPVSAAKRERRRISGYTHSMRK